MFLLAAAFTAIYASADMPLTLVNNSNGDFADSDIYIAIIGQQEGMGYIYYDLPNSISGASVKQLNESVNTLPGTGPFSTYADVFTRLSDIPGKVIYLGNTFGCRMFIGFKSPMYLHAHAVGYAGADLNNPDDPNAPIRWEMVEFSYQTGSDEMWINTTRVDAFQYPMGLEVWSNGVYPYTKRGEIVDYRTVIDKWQADYSNTPYSDCLYNLITKDNLGGIIKQPSKVASIKNRNIFDGYINNVWEYYRNNTADIDMGLLGRWTGKVQGDSFVLTCAEGHYWKPGSVATIPGRPTTEDVIEGAGVFASGDEISKTVQSMFCAAFNRGMFRTTTALQDWNPDGSTKAFTGGTEFPHNEYVKFFHDPSITASGGHTYAFAYDDTYDQSATCYANKPVRATVTIGGFRGNTTEEPTPDPKPDPDPQPVPDPDPTPGYEEVVTKNFSAGDCSEGSFSGPYKIKIARSGSGVLVTASFDGEYVGFAGPWLWNYTNGFAETMMEPAGNGAYEYLIPDVNPGETVTLAVKIAFAGGMGVSPRISYTVPLVSELENTRADGDCFTIYPNPVCSELTVLVPGDGELSLLSMDGACVARHDVDAMSTIDVLYLPAGMYLAVYKCKDGGNAVVRKLIKR